MNLFNPWLWLGFLLLLAGAGFTGYQQGVKVTRADYETAAVQAMQSMIARHNELAKQDADAAVKAEKDRQARRVRQLEKAHELDLEAAKNHRSECSWTPVERGLLNDLVDSANGQAPAATSVPDAVRPATAPDGGGRPGGQGLDWKSRIFFWRVPEPAR